MEKNESIYSASVGTNADLFPQVLSLYVKKGSTIADVTYGKGVFWRKVKLSEYKLIASDLKTGTDMCKLPYKDGTIDAVVIDPPYMPTEQTGVSQISDYYGIERKFEKNKWDKAVLELYHNGMLEAKRVLTKKGVLIVKCQDMVCTNKQVLVHVDLINFMSKHDFKCEDIFVLVQSNKRKHPQKRQLHARKNHSYFLVFLRGKEKWEGI